MRGKHLLWWLSGKEAVCQCMRCQFDLWVEKIPWGRKWQLTPVFLPGESHGQKSLAGYNLWGSKKSDTTVPEKQQREKKRSSQSLHTSHACRLMLLQFTQGRGSEGQSAGFSEELRDLTPHLEATGPEIFARSK